MTGSKFTMENGFAPVFFAAKPAAKTSRGKEVHVPVARDMHLCGLLPGRNFSRQIPRNFEARSNLAHGRFLPALLLHGILLFCRPEGAGHVVGAIAGNAMARPSLHKWTNETLGSQTTKENYLPRRSVPSLHRLSSYAPIKLTPASP
ncbi:hypothetical protein [Mesorhizobium captivum]|uniref:hypothetical protein n=1 Tax=Mesorhizobium captivum TaxID=3072319 RepID=UPI002A23A4D1|nr:hypothetical protein [Mesorhizobium sp. VK23E]MDX8514485.1 hypothetical protein [Mesorhizobium sp. VK23E]